jgi:hypothetical protein
MLCLAVEPKLDLVAHGITRLRNFGDYGSSHQEITYESCNTLSQFVTSNNSASATRLSGQNEL